MSDCIFCKIANHELESTVVYEDTDFMAFQDTNPAAPTHVLLIPKKHVSSVLDQGAEETMLGKMMALVPRLAKELGIADDGFRLVVNTGQEGGQTVNHLHFHILGGRSLQWPPG
ncbi:MAG: histidine triad nucleotide-binding protein [Syntrophaceticus sp.]|jgi:histidine triad (HIT) family protein|nr:histidine triad nucleotide-binding protein [Syntrophaceticus sp.]MDD3315647.1 histidine triad nucleotide-binding protein [Syntrophaceticus sp.]MDD4360799.1 histidine triad nucleotide-binding protein [Syntrophaceticus sp.]MDD4783810.1 histidine triad nucleotide-binding protein [Syntrophaceticus sp.]HBI27820.1 histidine triad nucleotide-binding protein [Peptococcaceae bacterium]